MVIWYPHFINSAHPRVDPAQEFARIRHSINLLETYVYPSARPPTVTARRQSELVVPNISPTKREPLEPDGIDNVPGMLASVGAGGLYAGPTSAALHLLVASFLLVGLPPAVLIHHTGWLPSRF